MILYNKKRVNRLRSLCQEKQINFSELSAKVGIPYERLLSGLLTAKETQSVTTFFNIESLFDKE